MLAAIALLAVVLGWIAVSASSSQREKRVRGRVLRVALDANPETVLVCLRAVRGDVAQVVRCVVRACEQASSPMRLRFAVVQEDTAEDVYLALEHVVRQAASLFDDIDLLAHARTMSVIRSNYVHAAGAWRSMYDDETVVVCVDAWIEWGAAWDVALVRTMSREAENAVLSAPNDGQFCVLRRESVTAMDQGDELEQQAAEVYRAGESEQVVASTNWPAVVGRNFAFDTGKVTDAIAVHHHFWALHGAHFARLPVPGAAHHVPLYLADVVLSDWLFAGGGSVLRTLPYGIFSRPSPLHSADAHLARQVPAGWDGRLHLSAAFVAHAGLVRVLRSTNDTKEYDHGGQHGRVGEQGELRERYRREGGEAVAFAVTARAQLGLTPSAAHTDEAAIKYGSRHAAHQQHAALQAQAQAAVLAQQMQ